jgi:hypothetical protein
MTSTMPTSPLLFGPPQPCAIATILNCENTESLSSMQTLLHSIKATNNTKNTTKNNTKNNNHDENSNDDNNIYCLNNADCLLQVVEKEVNLC